MATNDSCYYIRTIIDWMWKSNDDPCSSTEFEQWNPYTDVESLMIEEAFQDKAEKISLDKYEIDLKNMVHIINGDNMELQHPIKRLVRQQGGRNIIRKARFVPDAISPSKSFEQWENGASHFVFTVRHVFNLEKLFSLDNSASCCFLVEKAADGLIIEGKLAGQQKIAEWMGKELLKFKKGPKTAILAVCARLYSMDSFLFRKMNEVMRFDGDEHKRDMWHDKLHTFGPFAYLLQEAGSSDDEATTTVYRGATLTDELIKQYQHADKTSFMMFPSFTSTSRNPLVGDMFGGNTIFMIDVVPHEDAIDISRYSNMPDEEELLLHAYFEFQVISCEFDTEKNKWIIKLKSLYAE